MKTNLPLTTLWLTEVIIPTLLVVLLSYSGGKYYALAGVALLTLSQYLKEKSIKNN